MALNWCHSAYEIFGQTHQFQDTVGSISKQWASNDPAAAARWALDLPYNSDVHSMQHETFNNWARSAPKEAAEFLQEKDLLASSKLKNGNLVPEVMKAWAARAPEALSGWAEALPEAVRERALRDSLTHVADHLPEVAVARLDTLASPEDREVVIRSIGSSWGKKEPETAVAWMVDQPEEIDLGKRVKAAAKAWVLSEPLGASEWIGALDAGECRDHVVAVMVYALVSSNNHQRDFDAASAWVETIVNEPLRKEWVQEIEKRWGKEPSPQPPPSGSSLEFIGVETTPGKPSSSFF